MKRERPILVTGAGGWSSGRCRTFVDGDAYRSRTEGTRVGSTWWNRSKIGRVYNEAVAKQIGGFVREMKDGQESAVSTASGKMPRLTDFLPAHEEAWLNAISEYIRASGF